MCVSFPISIHEKKKKSHKIAKMFSGQKQEWEMLICGLK